MLLKKHHDHNNLSINNVKTLNNVCLVLKQTWKKLLLIARKLLKIHLEKICFKLSLFHRQIYDIV